MKKNCLLFLLFVSQCLISQNFPGQKDFEWPDYNLSFPVVPDSLKKEDAVILREDLLITDDVIRKRVAIKILTEDGLKEISHLQLPENFDLTNPPNWYRQGRFKNRKDPFIYNYKINYISARAVKANKKFNEVPVKTQSEKVCWVDFDGQRIYDYIYNFEFDKLAVGDVIEYMYEANVDWNRAQNIVHFNSCYPKLNYDLEIKTGIRADIKNVELVFNYKVPNSAFRKTIQNQNGSQVNDLVYHFDYLKGYNNLQYSRPGFTLPSVAINHGGFSSIHSAGSAANVFYAFDRYKWVLFVDTARTIIFDKYHLNIKKFVAGISSVPDDSTGNDFVGQLVDTLNKLKFITAESMNYGDIPQYALPSSEQLLKGRLTEEFIIKNYQDFLAEKKIWYYNGIVIDKRKSVINPEYRNHYWLERKLLVIPQGNAFRYYVPRHRGVTYLPDELPFYFEGTNCALMPCSNCTGGNNSKLQLKFIVIPKSTFNENTRSESATVKIIPDSMKIAFNMKENLSGQFSTLLRHYYNNDIIDSTVADGFYRKCTNKPGFSNAKIKKGSLTKKFPFRQTYSCTGEMKSASKNSVNLSDWFSFIITKDQFLKTPNHDIYIDFQFSDYYNFLFEFDKAVEITNPDELTKKLSNEYFEVNSSIVKQETNKYLLSVIVKVKQDVIPEKDGIKIMEFIEMLDTINNFKLNYKMQ